MQSTTSITLTGSPVGHTLSSAVSEHISQTSQWACPQKPAWAMHLAYELILHDEVVAPCGQRTFLTFVPLRPPPLSPPPTGTLKPLMGNINGTFLTSENFILHIVFSGS